MFEDRVEKGAAFLDKVLPGWENKINVKELDLTFFSGCILGQLYGVPRANLAIKQNFEGAAELGFFLMPSETETAPSVLEAYAPLTRAWVEEISRRRAPVISRFLLNARGHVLAFFGKK
jgi:hypothetical protein